MKAGKLSGIFFWEYFPFRPFLEFESFSGSGDDHGADGGAWIRPSGRKQVIKRNTLFKVNWLWVREIEIPQLFPEKLVPGT